MFPISLLLSTPPYLFVHQYINRFPYEISNDYGQWYVRRV